MFSIRRLVMVPVIVAAATIGSIAAPAAYAGASTSAADSCMAPNSNPNPADKAAVRIKLMQLEREASCNRAAENAALAPGGDREKGHMFWYRWEAAKYQYVTLAQRAYKSGFDWALRFGGTVPTTELPAHVFKVVFSYNGYLDDYVPAPVTGVTRGKLNQMIAAADDANAKMLAAIANPDPSDPTASFHWWTVKMSQEQQFIEAYPDLNEGAGTAHLRAVYNQFLPH